MERRNMLIEADELLEKLDQPNLRIYDATILFFRGESDATAYEQYQREHIPGAAFFDHEDFSDSASAYMYMVLPEADLARQIGTIGIDRESEVVLYTWDLLPCATRAWWVLRYAGHNRVRVLNGGLAAWKAAGGTVERGARQYEPARFEPRLRTEMFVGKETVRHALQDGRTNVVNTLPPENYEQAHITGSTCLPVTALTENMAAFLSDEVLAARLRDEIEQPRVITYCGGGIAATVNGMAHLMAGNQNVAVYDGSMSEWVGEGLPTTRGGQ